MKVKSESSPEFFRKNSRLDDAVGKKPFKKKIKTAKRPGNGDEVNSFS